MKKYNQLLGNEPKQEPGWKTGRHFYGQQKHYLTLNCDSLLHSMLWFNELLILMIMGHSLRKNIFQGLDLLIFHFLPSEQFQSLPKCLESKKVSLKLRNNGGIKESCDGGIKQIVITIHGKFRVVEIQSAFFIYIFRTDWNFLTKFDGSGPSFLIKEVGQRSFQPIMWLFLKIYSGMLVVIVQLYQIF